MRDVSTDQTVSSSQTTNIANIPLSFRISSYTSGTHTMKLVLDEIYIVKLVNIQETTSLGAEVDQSNPTSIAEADARDAIRDGIRNTLGTTAPIYTDQQIYVRNASNFQKLGRFDKVTKYGAQYWAFNYLTGDDALTNIPNISTALYVLEMMNLSSTETRTQVQNFITATKIS